MSNTTVNTQQSGGVGILGLLFVVLLVLKLTGWATLSWFWVFLPLIIGFALFFVALFILALVLFLDRN